VFAVVLVLVSVHVLVLASIHVLVLASIHLLASVHGVLVHVIVSYARS
jgi:hypothetical protein